MEPEGLVAASSEKSTCLFSESDKSSPYLIATFLEGTVVYSCLYICVFQTAFSFRVSDYNVLLSPPCSVHRQAVSFTWEPRFRKNNIFKISLHLLVKYEFLWSGTAQSGITFRSFNCDFTVPDVIKVILSKTCKFCPICKLNLYENNNSFLFVHWLLQFLLLLLLYVTLF